MGFVWRSVEAQPTSIYINLTASRMVWRVGYFIKSNGKGGEGGGVGRVMWRAARQGQREGEDTRKCKHKGERERDKGLKRPVMRRGGKERTEQRDDEERLTDD